MLSNVHRQCRGRRERSINVAYRHFKSTIKFHDIVLIQLENNMIYKRLPVTLCTTTQIHVIEDSFIVESYLHQRLSKVFEHSFIKEYFSTMANCKLHDKIFCLDTNEIK